VSPSLAEKPLDGVATAQPRTLEAPARIERRPSVLIVSENESIPSDRRVWAIARTLHAAGCEVVIVSPQGDESERASDERDPFEVREGIEIHRFPLRFAEGGVRGFVAEYASALRETRKVVARLSRQREFDVVHVCSPPDFMFLGAVPALRRGARLIFDHHDLSPELFITRFGERHPIVHRLTLLAERLAIGAADTVLATNESYRRIATERDRKAPERVFVVRNGPDLRSFRTTEPDPALKRGKPHLISYVGVMAPQDGVDYALHALADLARRRRDWHAVFAGEGAARPELERLATELGIGECVEFPGWLGDGEITRLLSTSDVCLSPEPNSPLNDRSTMMKIGEYAAMGRPIVAFDLQESRLSAGDAALYARANDASSFADRIGELLDQPDLRTRMGAVGRERAVRMLCWERSEEQLLNAYQGTLARGRKSVRQALLGQDRVELRRQRSRNG
jgi:glycosyltransferase involved in cell wall biosynthesis